jgi:hypothetical protein
MIENVMIANLAPEGNGVIGWGYQDLVHSCCGPRTNQKLQPFLSKPVD